MSGEKTEDPTPHRLMKLRTKGDVPRSADLCCAAVLAAVLALAASLAPSFASDFLRIWNTCLGSLPEAGRGATPVQLSEAAGASSEIMLLALLVPLAVVTLVAGLSAFLQVGPVLALDPIAPKLERLSPASNLGQIFGPRNGWEVLRALLKVGIGVAACAIVIRTDYHLLLRLAVTDVRGAATLAGSMVWDIAMALVAFAVLAGAFDVLYQRKSWLKRNRMSKDEVKREYEQQEGKPEVKQERRRLQMELSTEEMCEKVREEGVVLVRNPTHVAVVLKYASDGRAPIVVASGTGEVARRIIAEARRCDLPEQRDRKLARELLTVGRGRAVPPRLWEAVGELLEWAEIEYRSTDRVAPWKQPSRSR